MATWDSSRLFTNDLQASAPEVRIGLSRAGVTGVQKAIRIRHDGREKTFAAEISCTVDLDPAQKGVHMSRFPELFGEAIREVLLLLLDDLLGRGLCRGLDGWCGHRRDRALRLRDGNLVVGAYRLWLVAGAADGYGADDQHSGKD